MTERPDLPDTRTQGAGRTGRQAATSALNQHPRGVLKLNLPPALLAIILPALNDFLVRYRKSAWNWCWITPRSNLIHAVDLTRVASWPKFDAQGTQLGDGPLRLVVGPAFGMQHPPPSTLKDLAGVPAISGTATTGDISLSLPARAPLRHDGVIRRSAWMRN